MTASIARFNENGEDFGNGQWAHDNMVMRGQTDATDAEIDGLLYELYALPENEVKIVEGELAS